MTKQEIQELKASLSIREVIGRYTTLRRVGRRWMGLCPFHGDRHPSLSVNEEKGSFVCYACGERGDVFAFVSKIEKVGFAEAAKRLTKELTIENGQLTIERKDNKDAGALPERLSVVDSRLSVENEVFLAMLLPAGSGCPELTPTWLDFGVGQSPFLVPERWKAMRNRLVFPVRDEEGRLVGFAARRLSDEDRDKPKYINSETGELYRKSELLYGLYEAREAIRREGSVFLVEGYKDVLAMHAAGLRHTVALCGTALCTGHIALLKRYTTSVRVMLDADKAGRKATDAIVPTLVGEGMEAVRIGLPEGDDPDSLFRRLGKEAFAAYVREAVRLVQPSEELVLLGRIRKGVGLLSDVAETEKRERLLMVLEDCLAQLKGLSAAACRPATMDWRWVRPGGRMRKKKNGKTVPPLSGGWDGNIARMSRPKSLPGA